MDSFISELQKLIGEVLEIGLLIIGLFLIVALVTYILRLYWIRLKYRMEEKTWEN